MEYCAGGELFDYIADQKKYAPLYIDLASVRHVDFSIRSSTGWTIFIVSASFTVI